MQQHRSNSGEKTREHLWDVHRQRVRLIWQQEIDDRCSQSARLGKLSVEQCNATQFP